MTGVAAELPAVVATDVVAAIAVPVSEQNGLAWLCFPGDLQLHLSAGAGEIACHLSPGDRADLLAWRSRKPADHGHIVLEAPLPDAGASPRGNQRTIGRESNHREILIKLLFLIEPDFAGDGGAVRSEQAAMNFQPAIRARNS